jgi:hypothetical protein
LWTFRVEASWSQLPQPRNGTFHWFSPSHRLLSL